MYFYTYDEWLNNAYYAVDEDEIGVGRSKAYKLTSEDRELVIRSSWSNPKFISTYTLGTPSIVPTMNKIDCDLGCLYQLKPDPESPISEKLEYRNNRGVVQWLDSSTGSPSGNINYPPYITLDKSKNTYDESTGRYSEYMKINLQYHSKFERILIFQSIYSGAISFEEAQTKLEFEVSTSDSTSTAFSISTNMYSSTSLMIACALITFDTIGQNKYLIVDNISKFVYGHVDMDQEYNWGVLWKTFVPPYNSAILESSIMHFTKTGVTD